jgi:peptidoglycan hydrolase-like protein with peptidoglycan-binding domain
MSGPSWIWALVLVAGVVVGVAIAGRPTSSQDPPLRVIAPATTTTTTAQTATPSAEATSGTPVPPFPGSIKLGATGDAVRQWQQRMKDRGWPIEVDGQYGSGAVEVCRDFQRQKGLGVNGTVDEATWDATWSAPLPDDVS